MVRDKPKRKSWIYRSAFLVSFLTITGGGAVVLGALLATIEDLPTIEQLRTYMPQDSTFVYDAAGKVTLAEFSRQRRYVLTLKQIPEQLINCFLAIEDRRFYDHFGVDPIGVARAAVSNFRSGGWSQGASTISMQLPGNVLDLINRRDISLKRKFKESLLALQIERKYSKDQILELYLNQIYMGGGAYGVEAAAKTYFGKTVSELTLSECAALAGLPAAPSKINPIADREKCEKRRNIVLNAMKDAGYINVFECNEAKRENLEVRKYSKYIAPFQAPYFVDYARESILKTPDFVPESIRGRIFPSEYLDTGGLKVITTIDMALQKIAEKAMKRGLIGAEKDWHNGKAERREKDEDEIGPPLEGQDRMGRIIYIGEEDFGVLIEDFAGTIPLPEHLPFYNPELVFAVGELIDV